MTAAQALFAELSDRGVALRAVDDRLHLRPKAAITSELLGRVAECKPELLALLERFEERAAILEFDAGLTREEAESRAWDSVLGIAEEHP